MQLPLDCQADYIKNFLTKEVAQLLYTILLNDYKIDTLKLKIPVGDKVTLSDFGKLMFIDQSLYDSGTFHEKVWGKTAVWPDILLKIRSRIEALLEREFKTCVCIYYPNGHSGVDFHSDYPAFGDTTIIPSLSIGEEREFLLREKSTKKVFSILLEEGSLIVMGENCQERYQHSLPKNPKYKNGRINLTFRPFGY